MIRSVKIIAVIPKNERILEAMQQCEDIDGMYICTRLKGHKGDHMAGIRHPKGIPAHTWKQVKKKQKYTLFIPVYNTIEVEIETDETDFVVIEDLAINKAIKEQPKVEWIIDTDRDIVIEKVVGE